MQHHDELYEQGYTRALRDIAKLLRGNYEEVEHPDIVNFLNKKGVQTVGQIRQEESRRSYLEQMGRIWSGLYIGWYENGNV